MSLNSEKAATSREWHPNLPFNELPALPPAEELENRTVLKQCIAARAVVYRLLLDVTRHQAWEPWILFVLKGVEETAIWTSKKIAAIRALQASTTAHVKAAAPKIYSHEPIELIFEFPHPKCHRTRLGGTAGGLPAFEGVGESGSAPGNHFRPEKLFIHPKLMRPLTSEDMTFAPYPPPVGP